jgi:hypothetical protein
MEEVAVKYVSCEVNLNDGCDSPPNAEGCLPVRSRCYRCGQRACKGCSSVERGIAIGGGRARICADCKEDES